MKMRNLISLAVVGGALYAHRRHGGEWTMDSFQQSLRDLWGGINQRAERSAQVARGTVREFAADVSDAVESGAEKVGEAARRTRPTT